MSAQLTGLAPDDPGIAGGPPLEPPLLDDDEIAALYAGRRYIDELMPVEPKWRPPAITSRIAT